MNRGIQLLLVSLFFVLVSTLAVPAQELTSPIEPVPVQANTSGTTPVVSGGAIIQPSEAVAVLPELKKPVETTGVPPTVISGVVNANGTIAWGAGFTVQRDAAGAYTVSFPAGTWNRPFAPVVMGLAQPVAGLLVYVYDDGSGTFQVFFPDDAIFTFIAAAILP